MCYETCESQIYHARNTEDQSLRNSQLRCVKEGHLPLFKALSLPYHSPQQRLATTLERLLTGGYLRFVIV